MRRLAPWAALLALALPPALHADDKPLTVTVTAGKHDYKNVPVCIPLSVPKSHANSVFAVLTSKTPGRIEGQLTAPGIRTESIPASDKALVRRDLHFILPELKAGESRTWSVQLGGTSTVPDPAFFSWQDTKGKHADLILTALGGVRRPVLRYMYRAYDNSSPDKRDRTYKVFHHVYDPEGKRFVTNGGQTDVAPGEKADLLYPHHRGLLFGYMRCTYGEGKGTTADTWHAKPGDSHEQHAGFAEVEGGGVLGRHRVLVDWHGPKNEVFAKEERELTAYHVPGGTLIEFATRLKSTGGTVKLEGDPQHAGFQFRAANEVARKTAKQTYYLRPDGKGKPGETRNWEPKTKMGPVNLPWDALSFVLGDKRYTVAYLNHPSNPGESRWSERDYGRFGCYFPYELTENKPLVATYRVWLQDGEMTVPQVEALHTSFVSPPEGSVK
jgi:hypothetical protein